MLGTVGYLAPEQAQGLPVSAASDGYALAVVAYELLTGTRPFARDSATAEAAAHIYEPVPSAARAATRRGRSRPAVDPVFYEALAKDPESRFRSCASFVSPLRSALESRRTRRRRLSDSASRPSEQTTKPVVQRRRSVHRCFRRGCLVLLAAAGLAGALIAWPGRPARTVAAPPSTRTVTRSRQVTTPARLEPPPRRPGPPRRRRHRRAASDLNTRGYRLMLAGNYTAALPCFQQAGRRPIDVPRTRSRRSRTSTSVRRSSARTSISAAAIHPLPATWPSMPGRPPRSPGMCARLRPTGAPSRSPNRRRTAGDVSPAGCASTGTASAAIRSDGNQNG